MVTYLQLSESWVVGLVGNGLQEHDEHLCQSSRNRIVDWRVSLVVAVMALILVAPAAVAPCTAVYDQYGYAAYQCKTLERVWGVSSNVYVVDPTYTTATQSLVLGALSLFLGDGWIQFGYLKGWYSTSNNELREVDTTWLYMEYCSSTGVRTMSVLQGIAPWTWHTFEILFNSPEWMWECRCDGAVVYYGYYFEPTNGYEISVQGENYDTDDQTNGVMSFHDLKYLNYRMVRKGGLVDPTWVSWNGYNEADANGAWSMSPSPNEFDCWLGVPTNLPPTADFSVTTSGLIVNVDGSPSYDSDGTISTYAWSWGDESTNAPSPETTASHTYAATGPYTIILTVTDNLGATDADYETIAVTNLPPSAYFIIASTSGLTVTVDGSGSSDSDGTISTYAWDWEGDGTSDPASPSPTASHAYATSDTYTIVLTAMDNGGAVDTYSRSVTVSTVTYTLTVNGPSGAEINPDVGIHTYAAGTTVHLSAGYDYFVGDTHYVFMYWTIDSVRQTAGDPSVDVIMNSNHSATAVYKKVNWV